MANRMPKFIHKIMCLHDVVTCISILDRAHVTPEPAYGTAQKFPVAAICLGPKIDVMD